MAWPWDCSKVVSDDVDVSLGSDIAKCDRIARTTWPLSDLIQGMLSLAARNAPDVHLLRLALSVGSVGIYADM